MTDFLNPSDLRGAFRAWVEGPNEEAAYVAAAYAHTLLDDEELLMPTLNDWPDGLAEMAGYAFGLLAGYGIVHLLAHCQCGA